MVQEIVAELEYANALAEAIMEVSEIVEATIEEDTQDG